MNDYKLAIEIKVTTTPIDSLETPKTQDLFVETQEATSQFVGTKEEIQEMVDDAVLVISRQWPLTTNEPPIVNADEATLINPNGATVTGQVDAQSLSTVVTLEYGVTKELGSTITANESPLSGEGMTEVTFDPITGIDVFTECYYRIKAVSAGGTVYSELQAFKTLDTPARGTFEYDGITQLQILIKAPTTSTVVFHWGDGTSEEISGNDETWVTVNSSYSESDNYSFWIDGDIVDLTAFSVYQQEGVYFDISSFRLLTNLIYIQFTECPMITGSIESFSELIGCEMWFQVLPLITGDVSTLHNVTKRLFINDCPGTQFSTMIEFAVSDTYSYWFFGNNWSPDEVDAAIMSLANLTNGGLLIHRNNIRTPASNDAVLALANADNFLALPEESNLLPVDIELFTTASAVSDPAGNEIDGTAGWSQTGLTTGDNVFESQSDVKAVGDFAIKADSSPTPTANASIVLDPGLPVVASGVHRTMFKTRHTGIGDRWEIQLDSISKGAYIYPSETDFFPIAIYKKAPDTTFDFKIRERTPTNDGGVYLDDFSVRKVPTSPIVLKVEYDGVTQFDFIFKAPLTSTLDIYDGDGTMTQVAGNDATTVTHTTNYSEAGTYYFYVEGDYADITLLSLFGMGMVTGSVDRWGEITQLTDLQCQDALGLYGNLDGVFTGSTLVYVNMTNNQVSGDVSLLVNNNVRVIAVNNNFTGDLSALHSSLVAPANLLYETKITFDNIVTFTLPTTLLAQDNNWTSTMVDNCLISLANGGTTGQTITIDGNNAPRSIASNEALATLITAGNTVNVNEVSDPPYYYSPIVLQVDYDGVTQFNFKFKAPAGSTLSINDGDGTVTDVAGQDATEVTHTTNYATAGTYYFYVEGDVLDITYIDTRNQVFISGDISGWSLLTGLTEINTRLCPLTGSFESWGSLASLENINARGNLITGSINYLNLVTTMKNFSVNQTALQGDIGQFDGMTLLESWNTTDTDIFGDIGKLMDKMPGLLYAISSGSAVTLDTVSSWPSTLQSVIFFDCNWPTAMVDNCLIACADATLSGAVINIGGNNASRSAASNDAMVTLLVAGNTVTVNEDLRYIDTPIRLTVDFDGTTQFNFKFKAPLGSYLIMYDGDGTRTLVQGNDGTVVIHTTNYATAGEYTFIVVGDLDDIISINLYNQTFASGDISRFVELTELLILNVPNSGVYGDVSGFGVFTSMTYLGLSDTGVFGSIDGWGTMVSLESLSFHRTSIGGNLVSLANIALLDYVWVYSTNITIDSDDSWTDVLIEFLAQDCLLSSAMVDNALISIANGGSSGADINLAGTNAPRTEASTAALSTLLAAGNTVNVNYDNSPIQLRVTYDGVTQFDFIFKLPSTKYVIIDEGDGTRTIIQGQDDTVITHTTGYTTNKVYDFYVDGDYADLTYMSIVGFNEEIYFDVSGNLNRVDELTSMTYFNMNFTNIELDIAKLINATFVIGLNNSKAYGDVAAIAENTTPIVVQFFNTDVGGDLSTLSNLSSATIICAESNVTFDNIVSFTLGGGSFNARDCRWTPAMVDNCLISLANGGTTGKTINIGGNNAPRTEASTVAFNTLLAAGNTVIVNYDSPVELEVFYDAVTQFNFKFKLPSTKYVLIDDGDGTRTLIQGQDDVEITHTTAYTASANYKFFVDGDVRDITWIALQNQGFVSGDFTPFKEILNLIRINTRLTNIIGDIEQLSTLTLMEQFNVNTTPASGDVVGLKTMTDLIYLYINDTEIVGDVSELDGLVDLQYFYAYNTALSGDASSLSSLTAMKFLYLYNSNIEFNSISLWSIAPGGEIDLSNCRLTSTMVDNALLSFVNLTGCTINIGGNNAPRTSASNDAMSTLLENGNTVTVNYDSPVELTVDYVATQFDFKFKLPSTKYVEIHDGDGTSTIIQGQDDVLITHTTTYSEAGSYTFYVDGAVLDITMLNLAVPVDISGDIAAFGKLVNLVTLWGYDSSLYGDVKALSENTLLESLILHTSNVYGDLSLLNKLTAITYLWMSNTATGFNYADLWANADASTINLSDCNFTPAMVDNALESFVNLTGCTINLGGNNAARTSDSDAAFAIVDANNTLTVNE